MMDITVAADGAVYAIGNVALGNDLYKWTGSSWMPQTAGHKSKVSAGKNGEVWWVERIDSDGSQYQIYRRPGN